nr:hypothetical protein [uncultured Stomatobaculum sp.]
MQEEKQEKRRPKKHRWLRFVPQITLGLGLLAAYFSWRDHHRKPTQQELDAALTRYMQGKYAIYGDTLTPVGEGKVQWYPSDIVQPTPGIYEMRFQSEKYPAKHKEEVLRLYYNYEKETLRDNYIEFVLRHQIENKFEAIFNQIYEANSYELVMKPPREPYTLYRYSVVETVEEYLQHAGTSQLRVCVIRDESNREEDMKRLLKILKEYEYGIDCDIFYLTREQFDSEERKNKWTESRQFDYLQDVWIVWKKGNIRYNVYVWKDKAGEEVWEESSINKKGD